MNVLTLGAIVRLVEQTHSTNVERTKWTSRKKKSDFTSKRMHDQEIIDEEISYLRTRMFVPHQLRKSHDTHLDTQQIFSKFH